MDPKQDIKPILKQYEQRNFKTIEKVPLNELEKVVLQYQTTHKPLNTAIYILYGIMALGFLMRFTDKDFAKPILILIFSLCAIALVFTIKYMSHYSKLIKTLKAMANRYHIKLEVFSEEYNQMVMYIFRGKGIGKLK